ncbi:hypothetical protein HYW19_00670 [Candidatus Woesearchaeota archaeon]|nr:hypothetical protein [Candidatus Woesearchaeota archaeon]
MKRRILLFLFLFISLSYAVNSEKVFEVLETEKLSLNLNVDDPDADKLVYTFTSPLDEKGEWQTNYGDAGEYKSTITVSDGENRISEDVTIIVHRKEESPAIGGFSPKEKSITIDEGKEIKFSAEALDINKDELTYTWTINGEIVSNEKGIAFGTSYKDEGEYIVKIIVSDGMFNVSKEWNVNVNDVNLNEILNDINDITITETETASLKLPDFRKYGLNYEISEPLGNDNKWKTGYDDSGAYDVKITVKGSDFEAEKNVKVTVRNKDRAPKLSGLRDISIKENENLVLEFSAEDPDGDKAIFSVENIPQGAILEGNAFKWQPDFNFIEKENAFDHVLDSFRLLSKTVEVVFIAQSNELKDEKTAMIMVRDSNRPFVLEGIADIEINEGEEIIIEPKYNDPDKDKVSFSYSGFMNKNRKKTGFDDSGDYVLKIVATDGYNTETKFVNVKVNDVNRKPEFHEINNAEVAEGQELRLELKASDPDNDAIRFSARNIPEGAEISDNLFIWKPDYNVVNGTKKEFTIDFVASDGINENEQKAKITVLNVNQAPKIVDFSDNLIAVKGKPILLGVNAVDPDGDELKYEWDFGFFSKFEGENEHQRVFSSKGERTVKVTVNDGMGKVSKVWNVEVV